MDYEHFALVVDLLNLRPAEVIRFAGTLEREDPAVVDTQVQRRTLVILEADNNTSLLLIHIYSPSVVRYI